MSRVSALALVAFSTTVSSSTLPLPTFCAEGSCYFVQQGEAEMETAEAACQELDPNMHIALPPSDNVFGLLDVAMGGGAVLYWLGAYSDTGGDPCIWKSLATDEETTLMTSWYLGEPTSCSTCPSKFYSSGGGFPECCVAIHLYSNARELNDIPCTGYPQRYACSLPCGTTLGPVSSNGDDVPDGWDVVVAPGSTSLSTTVSVSTGLVLVSATMQGGYLRSLDDRCVFEVSVDGGGSWTEVLSLDRDDDGVPTVKGDSVPHTKAVQYTVPEGELTVRMTTIGSGKRERCHLLEASVTCL